MNLKPSDFEEVNYKSKTTTASRIIFLSLAVVGCGLYYYFQNSMLGGLGVSTSLFALVSFFHFNKLANRKSKLIDTKMSWFLIAICILGIILMVANEAMHGSDFNRGVTGGMILMGGLSYCLELVFTWLDNVR